MNERISKYAQVTLESCAYAGTGNVLKVQQLLAQAGEHIELKEDEAWKVCRAALGCLSLHHSVLCYVVLCCAANVSQQGLRMQPTIVDGRHRLVHSDIVFVIGIAM